MEMDELQKCQTERDEYLDLAKRLKADYLNLKNDEDKRREVLVETVKVRLIRDFLKVADAFELALADSDSWQTLPAAWRQGIQAIYQNLETSLREQGVKKIEATNSFNPHLHEPMETVPVMSEGEDGKIITVLQSGYQLGEMIIRPAKVRIGVYQQAE